MPIEPLGKDGFVATGPSIKVMQATVIACALSMYAKTGMRANRAYTPSNMLQTAGNITGKKYRRGQYLVAAADLRTWARDNTEKAT